MALKKITLEVSNLEEAKQRAEESLRVHRDFLTFETTERRSFLGLKKTYHVEAYVDIDLADYGVQILRTLFSDMGVEADIEMRHPSDYEFQYYIDTDENPVLIGKNGKTLDALQIYLRNLLNIFTEERAIVFVDIGGYKEQRKKQLEILATKTAKEVAQTQTEAKLEPMNAYERRVIHTKLADWRDVVTKSEGEKQNRHLVIKPKKK